MIRIEPREAPSRRLTVGIPIASAMLALLLAAIPLSWAGANIGEAYHPRPRPQRQLQQAVHRQYTTKHRQRHQRDLWGSERVQRRMCLTCGLSVVASTKGGKRNGRLQDEEMRLVSTTRHAHRLVGC